MSTKYDDVTALVSRYEARVRSYMSLRHIYRHARTNKHTGRWHTHKRQTLDAVHHLRALRVAHAAYHFMQGGAR